MTTLLSAAREAAATLAPVAASHPVAAAVAGFAIGAAAGAAYFLGLRFNTALYLAGRPGPALALQAARLLLLGVVLAGVALCGALPLLAAALGLLIARQAIVRRARAAMEEAP